MKIIYDKVRDGIRILRCFGYDSQVELPDRIEDLPVTELGPYVFSEVVRRQMPGEKYLAESIEGEPDHRTDGAGLGGCMPRVRAADPGGGSAGVASAVLAGDLVSAQALEDGMPALRGDAIRSVRLSKALRKIGAYAFYNCAKLELLDIPSSLQDLGAGLFTGCYGVERLRVSIAPGKKSCLKEVLAEFKQTLRVDCLEEDGRLKAKLIFPEFFEESIENTPARLLTQEMHGCGHRYRNAFNGTEFQYLTYDKLFPHIQVQEKPELVTELVLGRLLYPVQLLEDRRKIYETYADSHGKEIFRVAWREKDLALLRSAAGASWCSEACLEEMLEEGRRTRDPQALGILMDIRHKKDEELEKREGQIPEQKRRRRFSL